MKFTLVSTPTSRIAASVVFLPIFGAGEPDPKLERSDGFNEVDRALKGLLSRASDEEGFTGNNEQILQLHTHGKLKAQRLALLGLGKRGDFRPETLRLAAGRASKIAQKLRAESAGIWLGELGEDAEIAKAAVEGFVLGAYRFDRYRSSSAKEKPVDLRLVTLAGVKAKAQRGAIGLIAESEKVAEATNWARDLVNEPAAVMTPARLASEASEAAERGRLEVEIGGRREIQKLKMGMFAAVAQGSAQEPQFIRLRYRPKLSKRRDGPICLVGKAITFDSGGLSLKTPEGMIDMKTDMAGAAAVLATMSLMADLEPPFPVYAFIGACENMPSGTAYRPGDVLISRLGKTVEVTNTDAEGRLVLGDMLAYANEHKPSAIIDVATLTAACVIALGHYIAGVFGRDESLVSEVLGAAERAGEEMWRMPISDLQRDALRSEIADMKNSGERWGAAINAAVFLREFVRDTPWVHLDIAGPSMSPKERGYYGKGATGVGVRTLVRFIRDRCHQA